jgi:hypothetical protein
MSAYSSVNQQAPIKTYFDNSSRNNENPLFTVEIMCIVQGGTSLLCTVYGNCVSDRCNLVSVLEVGNLSCNKVCAISVLPSDES